MTSKKRTAASAGDLSKTRAQRPAAGSARLFAAACLGLAAAMSAPAAHALVLGRLTVLSNLGEPLRAEIEVSELTAAESESLNVQTASPAAFRAAGIDFNPALTGARVILERRGDGRSVLRITGSRAVNDPFLDVLLDASWASGRVSRSYTVLLDPPSSASTRSAAQVAPQITAPPAPAPSAGPGSATAAARPEPVPARRSEPIPAAPAPAAAAAASAAATGSGSGQVRVRPGDTAGRIAATHKPANVSLDQMLVALLQANPDAFVNGNVNRIRAGSVLNIPDGAQAAGTPDPEARQTVVAQSRDFNEFRRRLAARAPVVETVAPQRAASGTVQAQVEDRRPAAATPDRLTLSKGSVPDTAQADQIARASEARDSAARVAELSRNVNELNRLGAAGASSTAPAAAGTSAGTTSPAGAALPAVGAAASPPAAAPAVPASSTAAAGSAAPALAATPAADGKPAVPAPAVAPPAPAEEPSFMAALFDDVRALAGLALLGLLLIGWFVYRAVQRKRAVQNDSRFLESRLPQDSFFGASGGQHVNTAETAPSSLATTYSPSQLDAGGDVDPLAEADVYLAYGRDAQAEDILKEALKNQPGRTAVHAKLADLYARRKEVAPFNAIATDAHRLTGGTGEDWRRIRILGRDLDPTNALYQGADDIGVTEAGAAMAGSAAAVAAVAAAASPAPALEPTAAAPVSDARQADAPPDELGLDVDLDAGEPLPLPARSATAELPASHEPDSSLDMDFSAFPAPSIPPEDVPAAATAPEADDYGLDFTLDNLGDHAPLRPATSGAAPAVTEQALSFDLSSISLDLDDAPAPAAPSATVPAATPLDADGLDELADDNDFSMPEVSGEDALATKLALAEEFTTIGDADGARHLIEEVIAESSGTVRTRAERMLAALA